MPKVLLTSTTAIWDEKRNEPYPEIVAALKQLTDDKHAVLVVSNRAAPTWVNQHFPFLKFSTFPGRQSGKVVQALIEKNPKAKLKVSDFIVLGASEDDFRMGVNAQLLLLGANWVPTLSEKMKTYSTLFSQPKALPKILSLLQDQAPWFFSYQSADSKLTVLSLTNAGTMGGQGAEEVKLVERLKACLKDGEKTLSKAFQIHLMSSLCVTDGIRDVDYWGYYPESESTNQGEEIIAKYSELARYTFKKKALGPLFIRHKAAVKRHLGGTVRTDPTSQLESIHLNDAYQGKLAGKSVAVLDDYLTYGISFGVSDALLRKAGVERVIAISLGKFGRCANTYKIDVSGCNVFGPMKGFSFDSTQTRLMDGQYAEQAQLEFFDKFKGLI